MEPIFKKEGNMLVKITPVPAQRQEFSIDQIKQTLEQFDIQIVNIQSQKTEYEILLEKAEEFELKTQEETQEEEKEKREQEEKDKKDELDRLADKKPAE